MLRLILSIVCALAAVLVCASRAGGAEFTLESVNADTGAVTAKDAGGKSVALEVHPAVAGGIKPGQTVSIDVEKATMTLAVPVRVQRGGAGGGEMQATGNAASSARGKKTSSGSGTLKPPDNSTVTASEGSTAGAIRGRPNSSAKEFPNMVGEFSPASENPDNEPDDVIDMSKFVLPARQQGSEPQGTSSAMTISNYPRGGGATDLADRLAKALKDKEIDVALLGGQKYMVNNCLGLKVSAGKFKLKLAKERPRST